MRKYRGLTKEGKWVYGFLISLNRIMVWDKDVCMRSESYEVIPETVGQQTGLKDKTGTEIYHHDILQIRSPDLTTEHFLGEVTWDYMAWQIRDGGMLDSFKNLHLEIIGNTLENPELMENKK